MRFFNAQNRKIVHIESGIGLNIIEVYAKEYSKLKLKEQFSFLEEEVNKIPLDSFAVLIKINLLEDKENVLEDDIISTIFSNVLVAFSNRFEKQEYQVLSPSKKLLEQFPVSPNSILVATVMRIVDKPLQIVIERSLVDGDNEVIDMEEIRFA